MNILLWILMGGALGWIGFRYMNANVDRGMLVAVIIGMVGGFFGGNMLAPLFASAPPDVAAFSPLALFIASASAAGCLTISNMIHNRFGI